MQAAFCLIAILACANGFAINSSTIDIDWSKVHALDMQVEPQGGPDYALGARIIGGQEVVRNAFPYQVGLITNTGGFCGGSLISATRVLTAAHCTISASSATIILGAHNVNTVEAGQIRVASQGIINHPNYNGNTIANDIAIIFIPQVAISNIVRTITLAPATSGNFAGSAAVLTGWGRTSDAATGISPVLRGVNLSVITNAVCQSTFNIVTATNICTSGAGIVGGCNGDSGGPLVVNSVQVGIVSFGAARCQGGFPTAFARVSSFRAWIQTNAGV